MTAYNIEFYDNRHMSHSCTLHAKDIGHAIALFKEQMPGYHMKSILTSKDNPDL